MSSGAEINIAGRASAIRDELDLILASPSFSGADRRTRLLRFLVEQSLAGQSNSLKESVIAVEVFDRPPDYDPKLDSVVRVEMGRLRSRLIEYYSNSGPHTGVRIGVPKGSYEPVFVFSGNAQTQAPSVTPSRRSRWNIVAAMFILLCGCGFLLYRLRFSRSVTANPSIAVLPFLNLSGDPANEYLSDSITDELTEALAESRDLKVVARTSAFQFKGHGADVREIGKKATSARYDSPLPLWGRRNLYFPRKA